MVDWFCCVSDRRSGLFSVGKFGCFQRADSFGTDPDEEPVLSAPKRLTFYHHLPHILALLGKYKCFFYVYKYIFFALYVL